ncbi:MAG TPA: ABC transporter ATP-binding protein [Gemmataceae bacterium]|nr:ABC transporter ATP-binding protein [Gemmataceae bacterium]
MQPAVRVENLSKQYRIGARQADGYRTLRETLVAAARAPWNRLRSLGRGDSDHASQDSFWALKDVSFEVQPGEVVGIIGRNGAGKSTLLKILSRIAEPTDGRVELRGRIGSLLEVGTGFHPELTGRENVYLNGAILGMCRREIQRKFDEIVAFAEVEQFLDTPVKRYSSGMCVRLAFAVAAHLNLDTLLIDEVLAVGDASYQRRCIDRMTQLATSGATILFVSHNMEMIPRFCRRAILLQCGSVAKDGSAKKVTEDYIHTERNSKATSDLRNARRGGNGRARFTQVQLVDDAGRCIQTHVCGDDLRVHIELEVHEDISDVALAVVLQNLYGTRLITSWTREANFPVTLTKGHHVFCCRFRNARLRPGHRIAVGLWMATQQVLDHVEESLVLDIVAGPNTAHLSTDAHQGVFVLDYDWTRVPASASLPRV